MIKSIKALELGEEIIGINNFSIINFEINEFSSSFEIFLNFFLINIEIILQIYLTEFGNNKIFFFKSSINLSINEIVSKKSFK